MLPLLLCSLSVGLTLACTLPKEVGTFCDQPAARMFYYDSHYKVCQPFQYRGCGGNANQFISAQECKAQCSGGAMLTKPVDTAAPSTAPMGQSSNQVAPLGQDDFVPVGKAHGQWRKADKCGATYLVPNGRYETCEPSCPANHTCTQGVCCPSKDYVCSLLDDTGSFQDGIEDKPRFGWNHDVHSCVRFSYYGANGNYNNFPNFYDCVNYCKDAKKIN